MEKKSRVSARIEPKLAETIDQQCKDLDITKQEFMVRAIVAELGRFDVRMVIQLITDDRDTMQAERDKARKDYQTACEWRNRYKAERNQSQNETHQARQQRDTFEAKYEDSQRSCEKSNAMILAYQRQSWLARLFGRKPNASTI